MRNAPSPKAGDLASISALQSYMKGYFGGVIPEAKLRQDFRIGVDGRVGEWLGHGYPNQSKRHASAYELLSHQTLSSGGQSRIFDNSCLICNKRLARTSEAVCSTALCTLCFAYRTFILRSSAISWRRLARCDDR